MIGRLRHVVPVQGIVGWVLVYLLLESMCYLPDRGVRPPGAELRLHTIAWLILRVGVVSCAAARILATHPYFQTDYRRWLEQTPWTVDRALPQGPVHLVWEDGVVLGGLIALHWMLPFPGSIKLVSLFLIVQVLILSWTFFATGVATFGYLVLFGVGLAIRFWLSPWECFAVAAATYLVAYEGLWRSLARFPWPAWELWDRYRKRYLDQAEANASSCGWPYDRFMRDIQDASRFRVNRLDGLLVSMLIGFGIFAVQGLISDPRDRVAVSSVTLVLAPLLMGLRAVAYGSGYAPPISFLGRILNGYWIIPGYDRAAVGVLLIPVAAGAVLGGLHQAGVPEEIGIPAAASAAFATALLTPPRLLHWRLTGKHRMFWMPVREGPKGPYVKVG